jgi:4-hydroxy-tetrahydrodipicolinate synthase
MIPLAGIIASMPTPFDARGGLDVDALARELVHQVRTGVHGVCVLGGTGEFFSLAGGERVRVVEAAAKARRSAGARGPLVVGNFLSDEGAWAELSEAARSLGAAAVMVAPPPFYHATRRQFASLLERLARRSPTPIVVFNTPGRSGVRLSASDLEEIVRAVPAVVGIKDSSADVTLLAQASRAFGSGCALLQGNDDLYVPSLAVGCAGGILAMAAVFPEVFQRMQAAWEARRIDEATRLQLALLPVLEIVNGEPMPVLVKAAMDIVGRPVGGVRPPLSPEAPEARLALEIAVARFVAELDRLAA